MSDEKLYAQRDHRALEPHFSRHVSAIVRERLFTKHGLAAELAWRDREIERLRAALYAHPPRDEWRPASELDTLRELIGLAYGHLWMVNNELGTPNRYSPERAAYEARKLLRDTMTQEQRGAFINRVIAQCQPPTTEGE